MEIYFTPEDKPTTTTLLSLSPELRQQILVDTYTATEQCRLPPPGVLFPYHAALTHWYSQHKHVLAWVKRLGRVHKVIQTDVDTFVCGQWFAALQRYWQDIRGRYGNEIREYGTGEEGISRSLAFGGPWDYTDGLP